MPEEPGDEDGDEEIGMFRAHKTLLENSIDDLANMDPEKVATQLKKQGLFDEQDCQLIDHEVTKRAKNIKIIEMLQGRGPTAFDTFFKVLSSIDEASADNFLPVKHRILWFTSSPRYAATVTYALEKYFDRDTVFKSERQKQRGSYMLRKGRIFKRRLSSDTLKDDEGSEPAKLAQDVELCLAFPISETGDTPQKALTDVFRELGSETTVGVLSGVCVGVRGDGGARGEELRVKGGEVVLATEAVSLDGHKRELPLSSALMEAKTHLSQLPEENKEWFGEAKEKLKKLEQASGIPIGEHPRLVPHFDTIRQDIQATPTGQPHRLPRALASDSDTSLFYDLCAQHLGVEQPWFSCKGAIGHDMLNNADPAAAQETGSVCALMSTFFALEACKTIVDKLRLSSQTFNSRSK